MAIEIRSIFDPQGIDGSPLWFAVAVDTDRGELALVDAIGEDAEEAEQECIKRLQLYRRGCEYSVVGSEDKPCPR